MPQLGRYLTRPCTSQGLQQEVVIVNVAFSQTKSTDMGDQACVLHTPQGNQAGEAHTTGWVVRLGGSSQVLSVPALSFRVDS